MTALNFLPVVSQDQNLQTKFSENWGFTPFRYKQRYKSTVSEAQVFSAKTDESKMQKTY